MFEREIVCCSCCKKQNPQTKGDKWLKSILRYPDGVVLTRDLYKGLLMEKAVSDTLTSLQISHTHNPFDETYLCFQNKRPDITIGDFNIAVEFKNLSQIQVEESLSNRWLDENIINRPYFKPYKLKIAFFSHKPKQTQLKYLHANGWRVYSLGYQLTTSKEIKKSFGKIKQRFYWVLNRVE